VRCARFGAVLSDRLEALKADLHFRLLALGKTELPQRRKRCRLLRRLLRKPPLRLERAPADFRTNFEGFGVIWPLLIDHGVHRNMPTECLRHLLQNTLEVHLMSCAMRRIHMRLDRSQDERARHFEPSIEIQRSDERLEATACDRRRECASAESLSNNDERRQSQMRRVLGALGSTHEIRLDLRERSLMRIGVTTEEVFAHDEGENAVAEKLKAFIAVCTNSCE